MKKILFIVLAVLLVSAFPFAAHAQITKDDYYARSTLEGNELGFYDAAYDAIANQSNLYRQDYGIGEERAQEIIIYVYNDAPELFIAYGEYTQEEAAELQVEIDQKADEIIGSIITDDMTDYEKVEAVYYWVAENTKYGKSSEAGDKGRTIIGALLYEKATCRGLSGAVQYLLYQIDIPCYTVSGGNHAWNLIQVDGEWYNADISKDQMSIKNGVNELAFFLWDDSFYDDHEGPDSHENPELPACTSDKYMVEPTPTPTPTPTATPAPIVADVEPQEPPADGGSYAGWIIAIGAAAIAAVALGVRAKHKKKV